jgi:Kef-type K+ transport system membrane component KefB
MESDFRIASIWIGLAVIAALFAMRLRLSVALVEILVGIAAGNVVLFLNQHHVFDISWKLEVRSWLLFLAGFGSMLLTFLAGAGIEPEVLRKYFKQSLAIGFNSFAIPFVGAMLFARFISGWDWPAALICGIALSTTSVAVVYAVMIETGLNETELGKLILAACFVTDLGTVLALGACFANYDWTLIAFVAVMTAAVIVAPRLVGRFFVRHANHVSEPGIKLIFGLLFGLGALAVAAKSEAVLPAYLIGLALAGVMSKQRDAVRRMRTTVFALTTPFYFLLAGTKVSLPALWTGFGLIVALLILKVLTKTAGVLPLTRWYGMSRRDGNYTTLLMSTGLTFGTISALFGLNNGKINEEQYSILVVVVIASAIVPTLIAQRFFEPRIVPKVALEVLPSNPSIIPSPSINGETTTESVASSDGSPAVRMGGTGHVSKDRGGS